MIGIDSSILIDVLRGDVSLERLQKYSDLCTSEVVVYEVSCGLYSSRNFHEKKIAQFEAILDTFTYVFPIDRRATLQAARIAGELLRTGRMIGHCDALIAGSFLANGCRKILTRNVSDFQRVQGLEVLRV